MPVRKAKYAGGKHVLRGEKCEFNIIEHGKLESVVGAKIFEFLGGCLPLPV